jgi:hypothetical protein
MVKGLDLFKEHFAIFTEKYILIGGGACDMQFSNQQLPFRVTKDLDIVLIVEMLDDTFVNHFWDFVKTGEYTIAEIDSKKCFYRFINPAVDGYPKMLELFARKPDILKSIPDLHITDIPTGEEASSLSAILMDDDYYAFTLANCEMIDGVHVANQPALICLKVRAFLNNTERKKEGQFVHEEDITKHRNDVIRLVALISGDLKIKTIPSIQADLKLYIEMMPSENINMNAILRTVGIYGISLSDIIARMNEAFQL